MPATANSGVRGEESLRWERLKSDWEADLAMGMQLFVSFRGSETCIAEVEEEEGWSCYGAKKGGGLHLDRSCCSRRTCTKQINSP